jgi:hypothetical protein
MSKLNPKALTIAAVLLMVLALLFMATPLLRTATGFAGRTGSVRTFTSGQSFTPGQSFSGQGTVGGQSDQGLGLQNPGSGTAQGTTGQTTTPNFTDRQFAGQRNGLLRLGLLNGTAGIIVYAIALLLSLVAAGCMFMRKAWGKILGIIMGVVYTVFALFSLVPTLLIGLAFRSSTFRVGSSLNIWLTVAHLVLAIAVIVLASIPAKKVAAPIVPVDPPVTPA